MEKYYLGLDMGTSTVGWAVTDENYKLIRKKGKDLWGVREFEEANTAVERRTNRISRRRRQREVARIGLLKEYFHDAIQEIDPNFYARLENSKYHLKDKDEAVRTPNGIFADKEYTDKEYYAQYPTIFHLRNELIHNAEPHDVRLIFLALLNMYKHRGHFLFAGSAAEETISIKDAYITLNELLQNNLELSLADVDTDQLQDILSKRDCSRSAKAEQIIALLGIQKAQKQEIAIIKTICGLKGDAKTLFALDLEEKVEIQFSSFGYDEKEPEIHTAIGDELFDIVCAMKTIYDIGSLAGILRGSDYLSEARVKDYEKHKKDLAVLKTVMKKYSSLEVYDKMFRSEEAGSYSAYVNSVNANDSKSRRNMSGRKAEDFYKNVEKIIKNFPQDDKDVTYILNEIKVENFMPKQLTASNGVIPVQVHEKEMKRILKNAKEYLPFLNEVDESGYSVAERILMVFKFQIPYYIGPVTERSAANNGNGWVIRKKGGRVLPWNIDQKIDRKKTSEKFIERMVRRCTYISGESVMPKNSLMYESYCVLNEINNIRIDNERINVALKQDIYNDLFRKGKKVTRKQLAKYLINRGLIEREEQISGIDTSINNALLSYGKFKAIFGEQINTDSGKKMIEDIIFWCTVYGDSKAFLKENIVEHYPEVTNEQIKRITGIKFKDWGRFSRELLQLHGCEKKTETGLSLIKALWTTQYNFMELIHSDQYTFKESLEEKQNKAICSLSEFDHEMLDDYYFSAPVKKMVWQTLKIIEELKSVLSQEPDRIFIEMTRTDEEKGDKGRKDSRKKDLLEKYKTVKDDLHNWKELIENSDSSGKLRSKKMYLYLTQMGRDMYTGKPIDLDDLFNDNLYDIDHIYPRHFVKDDSIHNNLVLVKKEKNAHKSDVYPLEVGIRNNPDVVGLWHMLRSKDLITEEKYRRLTGTKEFTDEQKADFIARQLVETAQATKGVADILKQVLPESEIVYAKAGNVSDFRKNKDLLKSRVVNDFHHAHDAYLNIVVGNAYRTKFTSNPRNFIFNEYRKDPKKNDYHISKMFDHNIVRNGQIAWVASEKGGETGTIVLVRKTLARNTPMITRQSFTGHGGIADQTLYGHKKAKEEGYIPLKSSDKKMANVMEYGGFSSVSTAYFFLVEHEVKGKRIRTLETLPVYMKDKVEKNPDELEQYCENVLQLKKFSVRVRKINIQSMVKYNGFYALLSGKTENRILLRNAVNLCLKQYWINYIKKIEKLETGITPKEISTENNIKLYDEIAEKHIFGIFNKRPNSVGEKLRDSREKYVLLPIKEQCKVLLEILKLSQLGAFTADLSLIDGASMSGRMRMSKEITKATEMLLIYKSVTGISENSIDLLKR